MLSFTKVRRNTLHPFSKISADVFSLLFFKMSLHGQILNVLIEEVLLSWRGCTLFSIHGTWIQEISWFASHGRFHGRLTTFGHLCISHRCCHAHQLGRSGPGFWKLYPPVPRETSLNSRTPISAWFGHGVCGPVRILFTLCIRWNACMS